MEPHSGIREACEPYAAELTAGPISPQEYQHVLRVRRTGETQPVRPWVPLLCRFHALHPNTTEREMWHEAGHAVVAHFLGRGVERIARSDENVPGTKAQDCPAWWRFTDEATVQVAGWLAEYRYSFPTLTDPTDEFGELVRGLPMLMSTRERLQLALWAENRATGILTEHWDAVERVADRAMAGLPIEHDELFDLLEPGSETTS
jgi:hypothetical protein